MVPSTISSMIKSIEVCTWFIFETICHYVKYIWINFWCCWSQITVTENHLGIKLSSFNPSSENLISKNALFLPPCQKTKTKKENFHWCNYALNNSDKINDVWAPRNICHKRGQSECSQNKYFTPIYSLMNHHIFWNIFLLVQID